MTMKELGRMPESELIELKSAFRMTGNLRAVKLIDDVIRYYHKTVKVIKGRKVPIGTTGECFWMGSTCHSPYGDPWGIYTTVRIGIKDKNENIFWTSLNNVELAEQA